MAANKDVVVAKHFIMKEILPKLQQAIQQIKQSPNSVLQYLNSIIFMLMNQDLQQDDTNLSLNAADEFNYFDQKHILMRYQNEIKETITKDLIMITEKKQTDDHEIEMIKQTLKIVNNFSLWCYQLEAFYQQYPQIEQEILLNQSLKSLVIFIHT